MDFKKQKKILFSLKKDINKIHFKLKHKNLEKVKNEISRRGKIIFCKGRLYAPYVIALGLSIGVFSMVGATPFLTDKSKNYQKTMKEIDADDHVRIINQYEDFENYVNVVTLYGKWEDKDGIYLRNIKVYKLGDLSEDKIIKILNEDVNSLEDIFGNPISEKIESRNYLEKKELEKDAYLSAKIYSEDKENFIYVNQSVEKNIIETILWFFVLLVCESFSFFYRCFSSFNYKKIVKKINSLYSIDTSKLLENRLRILETNYQIMNKYEDIKLNESKVSEYLSSNKNIELSKLKYDDLRMFLIIAMETSLKLRDKLTYNDLFTYGTEIELEHVKIKSIYKSMEKFKSSNWTLTRDLSLKKV